MTDIAPPLRQVFVGDDRLSATVGKVRRELAGLKGDIGPLGRALGASLAPLAAGATLAGLTSWVRRVADGQDALNDLKDAGGGSIEMLSALEDLALRNGHSFDVASDALIKLNKALFEAKDNPDSAPGRALKGLGLSIDELMAKSPVERMQAVAKALASFDDDGKLEYNLALFGRSARDLTPLLNDMAEAGKLVATVTTAEAEAADKFNKELARLDKNALDVARALAGPMISALNDTIAKFREGTKDAKGFWGTLFAINKTMAREQLKLLGLGGDEPNTGGATGSWGDPETPPKRKLPLLPGPPKKDDAVKKLAAIKVDTTPDFDPYLNALRQIEGTDYTKIQQLNVTLGELLQLQAAGLAGTGTAQAIEAVRKQLEALDPAAQRAGAAKAAIDELLGIGADSGFNRQLDQMTELQRRLEAGLISPDAYNDALAKLDGSWRNTTDGMVATATDAGQQIGLIFSSAAGEALRDWQGFGDFAKGLLIDLAQLTAQETLLKPLAKEVGKFDFGQALESLNLGSLFGINFGTGGAFDTGGIRRFASGDVFGSPTLFRYGGGRTGVMGEAGPEAVMPLKRGPDGKLGVAGGRGGDTYVFQVAAGAHVDDWRRSQRQVAGDLARRQRRSAGLS